MKKIQLILALLCAVAQGAWAQVSVWDGVSKEWPENTDWHRYAIRNAAQMAWLIDNVGDMSIFDYWFDLKTDLDMGDKSWTPLGMRNGEVKKFVGHFNGEGHTIRINIDSNTDNNYQGLFAHIDLGSTVENLHLIGKIKVGNARMVGGIAGYNRGGIENCWVSADVESSHYSTYDADLGGIAGLNEGGIRYCCMTGKVTNTGNNSGVGGIAGSNDATIEHSTTSGPPDWKLRTWLGSHWPWKAAFLQSHRDELVIWTPWPPLRVTKGSITKLK